ncbi:hypothetical protein Q9292_09945 [Methylophilus sp. VKM B-3414]|uniref:hypothetical protein n=1 Tax=Methylophilus sp. VKM B-3414 TaxID=3076121 RepID=UPI0028C89D67|nr:hypothetical protein [Methylophilus sp. VKM B-3414]MDT7849933.1 hypothetical protein [Methylophilus sp. VKM B-3414]
MKYSPNDLQSMASEFLTYKLRNGQDWKVKAVIQELQLAYRLSEQQVLGLIVKLSKGLQVG